jgi:hypothetical protein
VRFGGSGAGAGEGVTVGATSGPEPSAMTLMRATTSAVKPANSTSIHVLLSPSIGDAFCTMPSIAITTWFGSSRPSVTCAPISALNGTFIDSSLPPRSLRVWNTSTCSQVLQRTCNVLPWVPIAKGPSFSEPSDRDPS